MSHPKTPADHRDERAADRDDAADRRDDTALGRDEKAGQRDVDAADRDAQSRRDSEDLIERFRQTCERILDRFTRIENTTIDPDDWPGLTPDALARLEAHTAEQRHLATLDREAVSALLNQLRTDHDHARQDRRAAADDRWEAASDRRHSAGERRDSGRDRSESARDRAQSAIEREQVDPRDLPPDSPLPSTPAEQAIATTRQRISDSRDRNNRTRHATPLATDDAPSGNSED